MMLSTAKFAAVMDTFVKIILVIIALHLGVLLLQFLIAGAAAGIRTACSRKGRSRIFS